MGTQDSFLVPQERGRNTTPRREDLREMLTGPGSHRGKPMSGPAAGDRGPQGTAGAGAPCWPEDIGWGRSRARTLWWEGTQGQGSAGVTGVKSNGPGHSHGRTTVSPPSAMAWA